MKRVIAVAAMLAAGSLLADGDSSSNSGDGGENVYGLMTVTSEVARTIVAIPWIQASLTNGEITVADVVRTANLYPGDSIHYYDTSKGAFDSWRLNSSTQWEAATSVTVEALIDGTAADKRVLQRGNALVLLRPTSEHREDCFYLWGQVASSVPTNEIVRAGTDVASTNIYTLIAPPLAPESGTTVNINDANITWENVLDGDRIYIQTPTNMVECKRVKVDSKDTWRSYGLIREETKGGITIKKYDWKDADPITAGTGFWYVTTNGTTSAKVIWNGAPNTSTNISN